MNRQQVQSELFSLLTFEDFGNPYPSTHHKAHEEECLRNPYAIRCWLRYLNHKKEAPIVIQSFIYERALRELPGSYKLWKGYLDLRVSNLVKLRDPKRTFTEIGQKLKSPTETEWEAVNGCFERALAYCYRYPVIWLMYCQFLMHQPRLTLTRRTFDRCLKSLTFPQHKRIWPVYLYWAENVAGGETCMRVWQRYLQYDDDREAFVDVCLKLSRYLEAAKGVLTIVQTSEFQSRQDKSLHDHWTKLCELIAEHAEELEEQMVEEEEIRKSLTKTFGKSELNVENALRYGIQKYPDQAGILWNTLAKWYLLKGEFDKVRDIYEEAIVKVKTVKDFSLVFDAYAEFEEGLLSLQVQKLEQQEEQGIPQDMDDVDVDMRVAQFEKLIEKRPFLINDVLLRQNPHNVQEWENRVQLFQGQPEQMKQTYQRAIDTIQPKKTLNGLPLLWTHYAQLFEKEENLDAARAIFEQAIQVHFKKVDELAEMWCQYAEFEIRHHHFEAALQLMARATAPVLRNKNPQSIRYDDDALLPQHRLFKSLKLWSFYVDLEESIGTVDSTKAAYDRILELKIANPQIVINYAQFLHDHEFYEASFKIYERGIDLFGYPAALDLWNLYLSSFIQRFQGTKMERARDLFEQALDKCPSKYCKSLFLMYAQLEEEHGLAKRAMKIYDRATQKVHVNDLNDIYLIYISKAASFFGLTSTRSIYEKSLQELPDHHARDMALRFVEMEVKLGEIDRARAILGYTSQIADPRKDVSFWTFWHDFEVKHGNEDTFKEMLRIKRSVQAKFNVNAGQLGAQILSMDPMAALENQSKVSGFVKAEQSGLAGSTPMETEDGHTLENAHMNHDQVEGNIHVKDLNQDQIDE